MACKRFGRAAGGIGYHDERFIEYDLEKEDEKWLEAVNRGQEDRLPARRMELLMWRLECANAEATDRALAAAGGGARFCTGSVLALLGQS